MIAYEKIQLKNKLEVYALPVNKNSDVISVDIFYKVGSRNWNIGKSGITHIPEPGPYTPLRTHGTRTQLRFRLSAGKKKKQTRIQQI